MADKHENKLPIQNTKSPLETALELAKKGFAVFPCKEFPLTEGEKAGQPDKGPYTKHGFKDATTDEKKIREYWKRHPKALIGIATGEASGGLVVIDLDKDKKNPNFLESLEIAGVKTFNALLGREESAPLPNTLTVGTWSGALQLYFNGTKEQLDNIKSRNSFIGPNIDVKANGGYVIASGSRIVGGIGDGREYVIEKAAFIEPLPDNIYQILTKKKDNKKEKVENKNTSTVSNKLHYRVQKLVEEALSDEIRKLATTDEGSRNEQINATAYSLGQIVARGLLDESTVRTEIEKACGLSGNRYIETDGYTAFINSLNSGLEDGILSPRQFNAEIEALIAGGESGKPISNESQEVQAAQVVSSDSQWEKPIPFDDFDLPSIDPSILPPLLGEYCSALAEECQVPVEMPVSMSLAVGAIAAQGKFETLVRGEYKEPCSLYMLCLLESANRKSSVVKACSAPLIEYEMNIREEKKDEIAQQISERKTLERAIEKKRQEIVKAKTREDRKKVAQEVFELEKELPEVESLPRYLVDNVTPEALAAIMAENNERIGIMDGEGGIFNILAGQYSKGVPNLDLFLKAHTGESVHVDRRLSESIVLYHPNLSLGLSVQPFVLTDREQGKAFRQRGLDARFLYVLPKSLLGSRNIESGTMPYEVKQRFHNKIFSLLSMGNPVNDYGESVPYTLKLSQEAYALWVDFAKQVESQLVDGGDFEGLKDWGGKFCGAVIRLASVLHVFRKDVPQDHDIDLETMQSAIGLGIVYAEHAKAAYGIMGTNEANEAAKRILKWICEKHQPEFSTQACWQAVRGSFPIMEKVVEGLNALVDRGYIREKPMAEKKGPGRKPRPSYFVNPATFSGK